MSAATNFLITSDGTRLHVRRWGTVAARGMVVLVHGLGEHIGRYEHVAAWFVARGFAVVGYDHRGHGESGGARGVVRAARDLEADLAYVVHQVRGTNTPLVVLGHSMGGAIVARAVADGRSLPDGIVLTSPALAASLTVVQRLQLRLGLMFAPSLVQRNGLDPTKIAHDPAVVRAYIADPLVHDRISARLAQAVLDAGRVAVEAAPSWRVPTLLLFSGDDHLVDARGSATFAAAAPREVVESERYDALFHEILNEGSAAAPVYARIERWLDARFPAPTR